MPLLAEPADLGHQLAQVRQLLAARRRAPARTAPAARGRRPAAAAPGRPASKPGVRAASPAPGSAPGPRATRPRVNRSRRRPSARPFAGRSPVASTVVGHHQLLAEPSPTPPRRNASTSSGVWNQCSLPPKPDVVRPAARRPFASVRNASSVWPAPLQDHHRRLELVEHRQQLRAASSPVTVARPGRSPAGDVQHRVLQPAARSAPSPSPRGSGRTAPPSSASP